MIMIMMMIIMVTYSLADADYDVPVVLAMRVQPAVHVVSDLLHGLQVLGAVPELGLQGQAHDLQHHPSCRRRRNRYRH